MELLGVLILLLTFCLTYLVLSTWRQWQHRGQMPPGPTPLPVIGNLLQVNTNNMFHSLVKLSEKYGPVYTIHLGHRRIVVLCGYDAVKEALVDQAEDFAGRGVQATFDWLFRGYGVAFSNGERPRQLRRFSITTLRNFGMGKRSIEERILEETHFLLKELSDTKGAPFDPTYILGRSVTNVISFIIFGNHFDRDDKEFFSLLNNSMEIFHFASSTLGQVYDIFYGVMDYLPGPHREVFKHLAAVEKYIYKSAQDHLETLDPNNPQDYIDCFLLKMQKEKENPHSEFFLKNLVLTAANLFFGGTDTILSTLRQGFLMLLKYPEVEEKIHKEIDRVIGRNRTPKMEDRAQMPYTNAVIHEIQRYANVLPISLARRVTRETQFRGYTIPKGTEVFPVLGSVMRDPTKFGRPKEFDPQHFLDESGNFKKNEAFMPFCVGKRICFGEPLARMELFLFLTSILQRFHLKALVPPKDIDISPLMVGFATIPRTYELCFTPR